VAKKSPIPCPAGSWTTIVSNFGSGYPKTFTIHFESVDGAPVDGTFEEKAALWIFSQPAKEGKLVPKMSFHRKWINGIYKIRVCPTSDVLAYVR